MLIRFLVLLMMPAIMWAEDHPGQVATARGFPGEFLLFGATLLGVALLHRYALLIACAGTLAVIGWRFGVTGFDEGVGVAGFGHHVLHEWVLLGNIFLLLTGFDLLAHHFSDSKLPAIIPRHMPSGRLGAVCLLAIVFVLSGFLDNIAAAMIGMAIAKSVFAGRVHVGYLAAMVAVSNAGGAGSVVGDSTTTMIWLAGHSPLSVLPAYVGAALAFVVVAWVASGQQHRLQPIALDPAHAGMRIDWGGVVVVLLILVAAVGTNLALNIWGGPVQSLAPWIGLAVWAVLLAVMPWRGLHTASLPGAAKGAVFLLCLVFAASLMPVADLPKAGQMTTAGLGIVSAVFDNIPLTALALKQGGYDWSMLAFAVGFGGSMVWFGSSAGVAVASQFPEAKSLGAWLRHGWYIPVAYAAGIGGMALITGWHPE
jgi:Na+/H+ antiporter NhaD/arsenite permease-like protein